MIVLVASSYWCLLCNLFWVFVWSGLCSVCLCLLVCVFAVVCFVCFASSLSGLFGTQVFPD